MRISVDALLLCFFLLFAVSCNNADAEQIDGEKVNMRHSSLLQITDCNGYTVVDVKNPWGKGLLNRYLLVPSDSILPENLSSVIVVRTPIERAILFSGVHALLFEELDALSAVSGVCDSRHLYSPGVKKALSEGRVLDCGSSLNVNSEVVAQLNPDAILVLPYENGGYGKLERFSFPLVECADYMESSPLGCAEWIRFYARLLGCAQKGDSIFDAVCDEYDALCRMVENVNARPKLMCELKSSSAWYVPGNKSTMGQMYNAAGADYLFAEYDVNGSVPLAVEIVLDKAADADIWLMKYNSPLNKTCASLLAEYSGYSHFRPLKEGSVYACNTRMKRIFEDSAFHPETLLKELVALFHPDIFPDYELKYYERMR